MIRILKGTAASLVTVLLLAGCTATQEKINTTKTKVDNSIASNATASEIKEYNEYEERIDNIKKKKKKKRVNVKKSKVDLSKFCFKDSHSIHYRAEERCK